MSQAIPSFSQAPQWDIFCRVIDNYGDIGVCWRLARQLAHIQPTQRVRLWLDDLAALQQLWPSETVADGARLAGVDIRHWVTPFPTTTPAQVVIEAFACDIPAHYLDAMARAKHAGTPPLWINLEYLSAEAWVEDCHRMTSIHPATGLRKTFFFPGFTPQTGGLLREPSLLHERDHFQANAWLAQQGIASPENALRLSLFAYENAAIEQLLAAWRQSPRPLHCLVPQGKILSSLAQATGTHLQPGESLQLGALSLTAIPFLEQRDYDRLLWSCDINFVRGEDSFVRAQWAAKPFVWHIYPQDDKAHLTKLDAFLMRYLPADPANNSAPGSTQVSAHNSALAQPLKHLWQAWNQPHQAHKLGHYWQQCMAQYPAWQRHNQAWSQHLASKPSLANQLLALAKNTTETL